MRLYFFIKYPGLEIVMAPSENMTLRPAFGGAAEALLPAFERKNGSEVKLDTKGAVYFEVLDVKDAELAYASYEIVDRNKDVVGSVAFPVFVSASSR